MRVLAQLGLWTHGADVEKLRLVVLVVPVVLLLEVGGLEEGAVDGLEQRQLTAKHHFQPVVGEVLFELLDVFQVLVVALVFQHVIQATEAPVIEQNNVLCGFGAYELHQIAARLNIHLLEHVGVEEHHIVFGEGEDREVVSIRVCLVFIKSVESQASIVNHVWRAGHEYDGIGGQDLFELLEDFVEIN